MKTAKHTSKSQTGRLPKRSSTAPSFEEISKMLAKILEDNK